MSADTVLSLPEAEALVERTKAAIDAWSLAQQDRQRVRDEEFLPKIDRERYAADRKRLDDALEGLLDCYPLTYDSDLRHARRYSTLIVDTAALYGQTP